MTKHIELPFPAFFDPKRVGELWQVPYGERAAAAAEWLRKHNLKPAASDRRKVGLLLVDVQNTFCLPTGELFVGGRSGNGAVEDNVRLAGFIYRNLGLISRIAPTMDTHTAMQIFHPSFFVNDAGENPAPFTMITVDDLKNGIWKVNPAIAANLNANYGALQAHVIHYAETLERSGKYNLTIWPYHAMLGGIGHALVPAIEEACFFHALVRRSQTDFQIKGGNPLTENYSVLQPEVLDTAGGRPIAQKNTRFIKALMEYDRVIIAGQAKSHCVAWTIDNLLGEIAAIDPSLASKVYLLEDCSSPVVIPGVIDYTDEADAAFSRFAAAGMHVVSSGDPVDTWPDFLN